MLDVELSLALKKWTYDLVKHLSSVDAWIAELLEELTQLTCELAQCVLQVEVRIDGQHRMMVSLRSWLIQYFAPLAKEQA